MSKELYFQKVIEATAKTIARTPPEKVRYSQISKLSGVSRAWIYKYFGTDTQQLIGHTIRAYSEQLSLINRPLHEGSLEQWIQVTTQNTVLGIQMLQEQPWIIQVYLRYRQNPDPLFQPIRDTETQILKKLQKELKPLLPKAQLEATLEALECLRTGLWVRCTDPHFKKTYTPEKLKELLVHITQNAIR
jgi:hypothetical protein